MTVRELFVKLGLKVDQGDFKRAEVAITVLKKGFLAVGAMAAGAAVGIGAAFKKVTERGDAIDELAQSTGMGTEALQELAYAAQFSGMGMEDLAYSLNPFNRRLLEAAKGGKEAQQEFRRLGVRIKDGQGQMRPTTEVLGDIADKIAAMPDGAKKSGLAMEVFGRSGARLIPMLNLGRSGLRNMSTEAHRLGYVMDKDAIKASAEFDDTMVRLKSVLVGLANTALTPLIQPVTEIGKSVAEWANANRDVIATRLREFGKGVINVLKALAPAARIGLKAFTELTKKTWLLRAAVIALTIAAGVKAVVALARFASGVASVVKVLLPVSPVLLVIGAAVGAVVLAVEEVWAAVRGQKGWLEQWIGPGYAKMIEWLANAIGKVIGWLKAGVQWVIDKIHWVTNKLATLKAPFEARKANQRQAQNDKDWDENNRLYAERNRMRLEGKSPEEIRAALPVFRYENGQAQAWPSVAPKVSGPTANVGAINLTVNSPSGSPQDIKKATSEAIEESLTSAMRTSYAEQGGY